MVREVELSIIFEISLFDRAEETSECRHLTVSVE